MVVSHMQSEYVAVCLVRARVRFEGPAAVLAPGFVDARVAFCRVGPAGACETVTRARRRRAAGALSWGTLALCMQEFTLQMTRSRTYITTYDLEFLTIR